MSLFGPFILASDGFLAVPPLINNSAAVWNSGHGGWVLVIRNGGQKDLPCLEAHRALLSIKVLRGLGVRCPWASIDFSSINKDTHRDHEKTDG